MENNNKDYTSVQNQAKKGLGTFVLTLSISLIVFSTIYYLMTNESDYSENTSVPSTVITRSEGGDDPDVRGDSTSQKTIFGEIADVDPMASPRQVLAGADEITEEVTVRETTQSTTSLDTGVTSITVGLFTAFVLFVSATIFVYRNPRKLALSSFERKTTKGL
ncbi:hypothetical protein K0B04_03425 [Patescibacteria group bacterium]|nr:hypothetical protein [Patescibacteria group bacterium]